MQYNFRTIAMTFFLVAGIGIIAVTFALTIKEQKRARVIQKEIAKLEQEKKKYEHDNMELQNRIAYLQSEHSYEKEAKKLNYKKQGEHVVVVRQSLINNGEEEILQEDENDIQNLKHYQIWLNYFF